MADPGRRTERGRSGYGPGDLVVYRPTGERWTVADYCPGSDYHPARVLLGRSWARTGVTHAEVLDADPADVQVVCPLAERSIIAERVGTLITVWDKGGELITVFPAAAVSGAGADINVTDLDQEAGC
jgi:hypothetical protein